jgi:hypothetical protein
MAEFMSTGPSHLERKSVILYRSAENSGGALMANAADERPADRTVGAESVGTGVLGEASSSSPCCPIAI